MSKYEKMMKKVMKQMGHVAIEEENKQNLYGDEKDDDEDIIPIPKNTHIVPDEMQSVFADEYPPSDEEIIGGKFVV